MINCQVQIEDLYKNKIKRKGGGEENKDVAALSAEDIAVEGGRLRQVRHRYCHVV